MRPRVHNVLSYSVTLLVFWAVWLWRAHGFDAASNTGLAALLWTAHFARRTFESAFVHRYSKPRVGPGDYLTEYLYYWGFAAWIAWSVTAPSHHPPPLALARIGLLVFGLAELGNAYAHVVLRNLRSAGSSERRIPHGLLFEWVSCPHYTCEIVSWVGFNLATATLAGFWFMLVGAGILGAWAHARHVAYRREFGLDRAGGTYPAKRRALVPGLF